MGADIRIMTRRTTVRMLLALTLVATASTFTPMDDDQAQQQKKHLLGLYSDPSPPPTPPPPGPDEDISSNLCLKWYCNQAEAEKKPVAEEAAAAKAKADAESKRLAEEEAKKKHVAEEAAAAKAKADAESKRLAEEEAKKKRVAAEALATKLNESKNNTTNCTCPVCETPACFLSGAQSGMGSTQKLKHEWQGPPTPDDYTCHFYMFLLVVLVCFGFRIRPRMVRILHLKAPQTTRGRIGARFDEQVSSLPGYSTKTAEDIALWRECVIVSHLATQQV